MLITALTRRSASSTKLVKQVALGVAMAAGGVVGGYGSNYRGLKHFANDTLTQGISLASARYYSAAFGNVSKAVTASGLISGYATVNAESYLYSTNTLGSSVSLRYGDGNPIGFGNDTAGYVGTNTIDKYTYATDTDTGGTGLTTSHSCGCGFGNPSIGYAVAGTSSGTAVEKYTYANDVVSAGVSLTAGRKGYAGGCSNASVGVLFGGADNTGNWTGDIVTYSMVDGTETVSSYAFGEQLYYTGAACNSAIAYSFGGVDPNSAVYKDYQYKYNFTTKALNNTGSLPTGGTYGMSVTSDSHGGLS